jgi:hypothetical protein
MIPLVRAEPCNPCSLAAVEAPAVAQRVASTRAVAPRCTKLSESGGALDVRTEHGKSNFVIVWNHPKPNRIVTIIRCTSQVGARHATHTPRPREPPADPVA